MTLAAVAIALPGAWPQVGIILDLGGRSKGSAQCGIERTSSVTLMAAAMALPDVASGDHHPRPRLQTLNSAQRGIGKKNHRRPQWQT